MTSATVNSVSMTFLRFPGQPSNPRPSAAPPTAGGRFMTTTEDKVPRIGQHPNEIFREIGREASHRPLSCEQAFGESLDPDKLERLGRYEVHLDRKLDEAAVEGDCR
jgi:hypothetical protein